MRQHRIVTAKGCRQQYPRIQPRSVNTGCDQARRYAVQNDAGIHYQCRPDRRRWPTCGVRPCCSACPMPCTGRLCRRVIGPALGKALRLIFGNQRLDHLVKRFAGNYFFKLVEGQVDPVVCDTSLREIIGPDAL